MEGKKNPKVLLERFQSGKLDQDAFTNSLMSLIENSDEGILRVESIELLSKFSSEDPRLVKLYLNSRIHTKGKNRKDYRTSYKT